MKVVLMRHGHDIHVADGEPQLSTQGKKQARQTAQQLADIGVDQIDLACCSPARRTSDTLQQVASVLTVRNQQFSDQLLPCSTPADLSALLIGMLSYKTTAVYLLVGHEPQLSDALLTWSGLPPNEPGDTTRPPWTLSRGEAIVLPVTVHATGVNVQPTAIRFLGRPRPLPSAASVRTGSSFTNHSP